MLLLLGLTLGAWSTPLPWGWLWVLVPVAVAVSMLLTWRFGAWGVAVPVVLHLASILATGPYEPSVWWIPVAALSGAWMGLREEGGGPGAGERAWMLLPLLLLAAVIPWTVNYSDKMVEPLQRVLADSAQQRTEVFREMGVTGQRLVDMQREAEQGDAAAKRMLPQALPTLLFMWMALLVSAGRGLGARLAGWWRWPPLSRRRFAEWRLPDGVIWLFMAGIAMLLIDRHLWAASAWTLLVVPALGYCLQGVAVVESLMLARGVPPAIIALTLVFVAFMAPPVFVLAAVSVGVSDVWLDFRRLEDVSDGLAS
ncbi:MAG: DUF2232 domain-containing protein [Candidatus Eisenbacteria bacterium]